MKNIHVIPTDKASRLHTYKGILNLAADEFVAPTIVKNDLINLNIYITSDEEIKEEDWCVDTYKLKNNHNPIFKWSDKFKVDAKKIILTTDQSLDDVQPIDDEFLEWFVKNPSCEEIELKKGFADGTDWGYNFLDYKIIIPKEEPKQMSKQTAVEWFNDEILIHLNFDQRLYLKDISKQAKEMEKEQITDAFDECGNWQDKYSDSEHYYNETYKKIEKSC